MNIADRIQHLRKVSGLSQEELADKIGVSRQTVSKWEAELSVPDTEKVIIMSDLFDVTTDYLLKGIEPVKEDNSNSNKGIIGGLKGNIDIILIAVMYLGYIVASTWWHESRTVWASVLSILVIAVTLIVGILARRGEWVDDIKYFRAVKIIFPIFSFAVLSLVYGCMGGDLSPYPMYTETATVPVKVFYVGLFMTLNILVFRRINSKKKRR